MGYETFEMPKYNPPAIAGLLRKSRSIAVVGLSPKEERDSNRVARYLIEQGYQVIPVNPGHESLLGRTCYKRLSDIPGRIDIVNFFIAPFRVPQVAEEAIAVGAGALWMQIGVVHNEAAAKAGVAGVPVVMNRCIMVEHKKLLA